MSAALKPKRLGRVLAWGLLGLGLYLLALLLNLPAAHVAGWLKLPLAEVRGSVWQGTAQLRLPQVQLEQLTWRLGLGAPWATPLVADVKVQDDSLKAQSQVGLSWNGAITLSDTRADMRLNHALLAQRLPVPLDGVLRFKAASAQWSGGLRQAKDAQLELSELTLRMGNPLLLGSFIAQAEVQNGVLNTSLRDVVGALLLQGEIKGDAASGVSLQARAEAKPDAPAALLDTLNLLPAAPEGGVVLQTHAPAPWLARVHE